MTREKVSSKVFFFSSCLILLLLFLFGVTRAYQRGANDFSVFYEAWRLVSQGRGLEIYRESPDRFLYCPGFAWIFSPLGRLPKDFAFNLWCLAKVGSLSFIVTTLGNFIYQPIKEKEKKRDRFFCFSLSIWGVILFSRPLLIDVEYGQVNLLILAACLWGLGVHFKSAASNTLSFMSWAALSFAAVAKLFPLPLLIVPWVITQGISPRKVRSERLGSLFGVLVATLSPVFTLGGTGLLSLMRDWSTAVLARGLPMESHNQSFSAFLFHYLSGVPTHVISEGMSPLLLGQSLLSVHSIALLSFSWTFLMLGILLGWILSGSNHSPFKWIGVVLGLLIVPSHLVWKPYFVSSIPLAVYILGRAAETGKKSNLVFIFLLFLGINFTGFDFLGHSWAAHIEAASLMLMIHLSMLVFVATRVEHQKVVTS